MKQNDLSPVGIEKAAEALYEVADMFDGMCGAYSPDLNNPMECAQAAISAYLECVDNTYIGCPHCQAEFAIGDGL